MDDFVISSMWQYIGFLLVVGMAGIGFVFGYREVFGKKKKTDEELMREKFIEEIKKARKRLKEKKK